MMIQMYGKKICNMSMTYNVVDMKDIKRHKIAIIE